MITTASNESLSSPPRWQLWPAGPRGARRRAGKRRQGRRRRRTPRRPPPRATAVQNARAERTSLLTDVDTVDEEAALESLKPVREDRRRGTGTIPVLPQIREDPELAAHDHGPGLDARGPDRSGDTHPGARPAASGVTDVTPVRCQPALRTAAAEDARGRRQRAKKASRGRSQQPPRRDGRRARARGRGRRNPRDPAKLVQVLESEERKQGADPDRGKRVGQEGERRAAGRRRLVKREPNGPRQRGWDPPVPRGIA